jgi:hypothetical protein
LQKFEDAESARLSRGLETNRNASYGTWIMTLRPALGFREFGKSGDSERKTSTS